MTHRSSRLLLVAIMIVVIQSSVALAQVPVTITKILDNGPTNLRLNIIVFGDV